MKKIKIREIEKAKQGPVTIIQPKIAERLGVIVYNIYIYSVATDEGPSPKLALSEGGSRGNIES